MVRARDAMRRGWCTGDATARRDRARRARSGGAIVRVDGAREMREGVGW